MNTKIFKLLIVFIFTLVTFYNCTDEDTINEKGSTDAVISTISPTEQKPNKPITITGSGFSGLLELYLNNTQVTDFDMVDDSTINLNVPNNTPVGDALITIIYPKNARVTFPLTILLSEPPIISAYENVQDVNDLLIEGTNFFDLTVTLDGEAVTPAVTDGQTKLSFDFPESHKNGLAGTLNITNPDGFVDFTYISVGDKLYLFQEDTYSEQLLEDWDGNGVGGSWTGPSNGATDASGVQAGGPTGSYLKMVSNGTEWGAGNEFNGTNYGLPDGVSGRNFYLVADIKYNNPDSTGAYMIVQLDDSTDPQIIFYGDDLPEFSAQPMFWSTISIGAENATGSWQTVAWSQYHDFGPRYRSHDDKTAALYPQNELRPEDSDAITTLKFQIANDGVTDVDVDNIRIIYFD